MATPATPGAYLIPDTPWPTCQAPGCSRRTRSRGTRGGNTGLYCPAHAKRISQYGSLLDDRPIKQYKGYSKGIPCKVEGCDLDAQDIDMCTGHAQRWRKYGDTFPDRPLKGRNGGPPQCLVERCKRDATAASGLCGAHEARRALYGDDADMLRVIRGEAEGYTDPQGYRRVKMPGGGYVREHRLIMAHLLGRPLYRHENVHHVNGQPGDNGTDGPLRVMPDGKLRSGNLELWSTKQPKGQAVTDKVAYAREILSLYGELVPEAA